MIVVCRLMPVASHDTQHFNIYKKIVFVPFYWMHYLKTSQCCFISSSIHTTNYQCKSLLVNADRLFLLSLFFLFFFVNLGMHTFFHIIGDMANLTYFSIYVCHVDIYVPTSYICISKNTI